MSFRDKSVLITGASSGIGRALAESLAGEGAKLTLVARGEDALAEVARACREAGGEALVAPADVGDADACARAVAVAVAEYGTLDIVVNNAGISMWARFDEVEDLGVFERIMRVNYLGAVYITHHALPHLMKSDGLLVAISSLTGKTGVPTRSGYGASKHAMQGFFDSLRVELRETGVDVLVVSPGFVDTAIRARAFGPDGRPREVSPRDESKANMSVERCVSIIAEAMRGRKREVVMTPRAKLGQWIKLFAPSLVDRIAARAVDDPGKPGG